jgi:hypothetical protein
MSGRQFASNSAFFIAACWPSSGTILLAIVRDDDVYRRLMTIPGVGPVVALSRPCGRANKRCFAARSRKFLSGRLCRPKRSGKKAPLLLSVGLPFPAAGLRYAMSDRKSQFIAICMFIGAELAEIKLLHDCVSPPDAGGRSLSSRWRIRATSSP